MRGTRVRLVLAAFGLSAALIAAGCGDSGGGGGGSLGTITDGTLVVGSDIPYPPFESGRSASTYTGYDIDLVNEIAKRLDLKVEVQDTSFDTIFRDLAQGKFDMVASATTITPERQQEVDFSQGYYETDQSLSTTKGSDIQTVDDITSDSIVGAQKSTTGATYSEDETDATVRTYGEVGDAFNALEAGQVDAVINDYSSSADEVNAKPDLEIVQKIVTKEVYGLAFQQGDTSLEDAVNGALTDMKDDGTFTKIYKQWFHEAPPDTVLKAS